MSAGLESHRDRFEPREWWLIMKMSVLYAQSFRARVFGDRDRITQSGEEILSITLAKAEQGCDGYIFKDGDILFFYYLCRCCRKTVLTLQHPERDRHGNRLEGDRGRRRHARRADRTGRRRFPATEPRPGAVRVVHERAEAQGQAARLGTGFPKYGAENWDVERIAKDLRITPATVAKYRSRLREFLEEFEIKRARRSPA